MKKGTKIVLAISAAMIVFGSGLFVTALAISGGNLGVTWNPQNGISRSFFNVGRSSGRLTNGATATGAFQSIDLNTDYGCVKLIPGDDYRVEHRLLADYPPVEISVNNGTLTVRNTPGNIDGLLNVDVFGSNGHGNSLNDAYIYVYYPQGTVFADITVSDSLGAVELTNCNASGTVDINADLGKVSLQQVTAESLIIEADLGSVSLNTVTADTLEAVLSLGELTARSCTLGDTNINNDMGSITLQGNIAGNVDISCSMGSVEFTTSRPRSDFSVYVSTDLARTEVDGQRYRSGSTDESGATYSVTVSCDMGSAELWFGK